MSPRTRQRLHELLDLALDALAEDKAEEPKKRKARALKLHGVPLDEASIRRGLEAARKGGYL